MNYYESVLEVLKKDDRFFTKNGEFLRNAVYEATMKTDTPCSYTRYKNKIGLVDRNGDYISTSNDVELVFPYKDCVLEGGQTKEDQKRSEIFYNETLAPDEVDRLLYPKVFTNAKRYTIDGVQDANNFSKDDNLIIKGNNLMALGSLLSRYESKINLIYIDMKTPRLIQFNYFSADFAA